MPLVELENIRLLCEATGEFLEIDPRDLMSPRDKSGFTIIRVEKIDMPMPTEVLQEELSDVLNNIDRAESSIDSAKRSLMRAIAAFEKRAGLKV